MTREGLVAAVCRSTEREDAGQIVLREVIAEVQRHLPVGARALRGLFLHRPSRGPTFVVVEPGAGASVLPSATAWRWVSAVNAPILMDVALKRVSVAGGEQLSDAPDEFLSNANLLGRGATHVLAVPLTARGARPDGMVCVEVDCRERIGTAFAELDGTAPTIALWVAAAAPLALLLPMGGTSPEDPLLPVLGTAMTGVRSTLAVFAGLDETLLLRGPTGTGKSHLARWCHAHSRRASGPFEAVHLHAVPSELREGELFGWRRGAFTGAMRDHVGAAARAEGGTLFIDEIDKLPLAAQGKLLRLLDERRYTPLGDGRERTASVRFVVATNVDLEEEVREGRFLVDLYYRVNVLPIEVPALATRRDEIGRWARYQIADVRGRHDGGPAELSDGAEALLTQQSWPGNLRQLHSVVLRAWAFARAVAATAVQEDHVRRALLLEPGSSSSLAPFLRAADALVDASIRGVEAGRPPLPLELAEAFTGLVLASAAERLGGEREAFLHFGLEERTKGGNHLKTWRREQERVAALKRALG